MLIPNRSLIFYPSRNQGSKRQRIPDPDSHPQYWLRQLSGFESRHLSKHKMIDIGKGVANSLEPAKKSLLLWRWRRCEWAACLAAWCASLPGSGSWPPTARRKWRVFSSLGRRRPHQLLLRLSLAPRNPGKTLCCVVEAVVQIRFCQFNTMQIRTRIRIRIQALPLKKLSLLKVLFPLFVNFNVFFL